MLILSSTTEIKSILDIISEMDENQIDIKNVSEYLKEYYYYEEN